MTKSADTFTDAARDSNIRIVTEAELRRCVGLSLESLAAVERAFTWLAEDRVDMPPVQHVSVADGPGDVDIKSACVEGLERMSVKMASGFYGNRELGLPSGSGLMVLLSTRTGRCEAVLLDNGYLTDIRTALAGAVAAKHLAREDTSIVGVVGTGRQAYLQARALHLVRPFANVYVWGRDGDRAKTLCRQLAEELQVDARVASEPANVMAQADCVVTTTAAQEPLILAQHLRPGQHITAMGSDLPGKQELEPEVLLAADLYVCDRIEQCAHLGELQHVPTDQRSTLQPRELGEITAGSQPGRTSDEQITVCDLTGLGVQDTAIATWALKLAEQSELGLKVR